MADRVHREPVLGGQLSGGCERAYVLRKPLCTLASQRVRGDARQATARGRLISLHEIVSPGTIS